jgi:hypothetical protein
MRAIKPLYKLKITNDTMTEIPQNKAIIRQTEHSEFDTSLKGGLIRLDF